MPPVLGAGVTFADALVVLRRGDGDGVFAVAEAKKESSSPSRNSSSTSSSTAVPSRSPENIWAAASSACRRVSQMTTPLPAARPSALDDDGEAVAGELFADFVEGGADGVGGCGDFVEAHELLAKALEVSSMAASLVGPKTRRLRSWSSSTMPSESGTSGPMTVRAGFSCSTTARSAARLATSTGMQRARAGDATIAGGADDFSYARGFFE